MSDWMTRRVCVDLRRAAHVLGGGGDADVAEELVRGALDRLRAAAVVRAVDARHPAEPAGDTCTVLAARSAEPVTEWLLIPFGEVVVDHPVSGRDFTFTREHAEAAAAWFASLGRKLAIDYEHQSIEGLGGRADGLRPAAGWIGGLEVRDDGLWAVDVTWTERARTLLASGEYRYFSPVIFWTDEDYSAVAALGPVALTNDPAMRGVAPLAASRLRVAEDEEAPDDVEELQRELEAARGRIVALRRELAAQQADAFVERGMRAGKIVDSTSMDWRADHLRDAAEAEARLSRSPVLLPPGRVVTDQVDDVAEASPAGVEAHDLAAFERAVAAGRVKLGR